MSGEYPVFVGGPHGKKRGLHPAASAMPRRMSEVETFTHWAPPKPPGMRLGQIVPKSVWDGLYEMVEEK